MAQPLEFGAVAAAPQAASRSAAAAKCAAPWVVDVPAGRFGTGRIWAGTLRKRKTNIGTPPDRIETELPALVADLRAWEKSGMPLVEQAARLHHAAVRIHPFLSKT